MSLFLFVLTALTASAADHASELPTLAEPAAAASPAGTSSAAEPPSADPRVAPPAAAAPVLAPPVASPAAAPSLAPSDLPALEIRDAGERIRAIDLTSSPEDLWERIRNGFSMPDLQGDLVARHQAWYLNRPQQLARLAERSRRYLHHIVEEIERRGLPTELALLPMVESSYNPMAMSPARASGLWQFIPSTGRNYGLQQNWWVDERRDIIAATSAALDYLQTIYEMHGDWHLALASYNWGEGAVGRAIEKNRAKGLPTDYLSLNMPAETRNYVPKLQALKNIVAQPQLFNVSLESIPNRAYFATVEKPAEMDLAVAARLAEIPLDELKALNPGYNRPVTSGQARIALPADKVETFFSNLESHDKPLVSWRTYTFKRGDRLASIAKRFGLSLAALRSINGIGARNRVVAGQTLLVPARGGGVITVNEALVHPEAEEPPPRKARGRGKVRKGGKPATQREAKARAPAKAKAPAGKKAKAPAAAPAKKAAGKKKTGR